VTVSKQGNHSVTFSAWDTQGNLFKSSRTIPSTYTYGWSECPPRDDIPCTPGFDDEFSTIPLFNSYVDNTFPIMAKITQNPHTVTVMKAYLDNTLVATSNGPTMASTVENAPSGTHILTLQAWDTTGVMYRVHYNINVNVPH
jgi:hypothetical protein